MRHGLVAQLVEQRPLKPRVVGSIPTQPTSSHSSKDRALVFGTSDVGSIPTESTTKCGK
jgi:hypothetical protein